MIRCLDLFQALRYQGVRQGESKLGRVCEFVEEVEQNCLHEIRPRRARRGVGLSKRRLTDLLVGHLDPGERWSDMPDSVSTASSSRAERLDIRACWPLLALVKKP